MRPQFDPRDHLRTLDDGNQTLDLKWRLVWLRSEHRDAIVETQVVPSPEGLVTCRATIKLGNGASSSGHGSAPVDVDDGRAIEQAEDHALQRALSALGYGAEFDQSEATGEYSSGEGQLPVSLVTARELVEQEYEPAEPAPPASPEEEPAPPSQKPRSPQPSSASDNTPAAAEDYSWTKFWEWARTRGYRNADQLQEVLGIDDIRAHTPLEVRRMLKRYELTNPPNPEQGQ